MDCPNCAGKIADVDTACKLCGYEVKCPRCSNLMRMGDVTCKKCGLNIDERVSKSPPAPVINAVLIVLAIAIVGLLLFGTIIIIALYAGGMIP